MALGFSNNRRWRKAFVFRVLYAFMPLLARNLMMSSLGGEQFLCQPDFATCLAKKGKYA